MSNHLIIPCCADKMHRLQNPADCFGHIRTHKQDEESIIKLLGNQRIIMEPLISEIVNPVDAQSIYDRLLARKEQLMLGTFQWCT